MGAAGAPVIPATDLRSPLHHDGTDHRIGRRPPRATPREAEGLFHPPPGRSRLAFTTAHEKTPRTPQRHSTGHRHTTARRPAFSHPDFHGRPRNYTGSAEGNPSARGLYRRWGIAPRPEEPFRKERPNVFTWLKVRPSTTSRQPFSAAGIPAKSVPGAGSCGGPDTYEIGA